jgi:SAM-dependent methyltransferase
MGLKHLLRRCPICHHACASDIHRGEYELPSEHLLPAQLNIVCCDSCGFCFTDTGASQAVYDLYYAEMSKYADARLSTGSGGSTADSCRLEDLALAICTEALPAEEDAVLDLGCGVGGLLDSLAKRGLRNLWGLDPAPACAAHVEKRGHNGRAGTIKMNPFQKHFFDGIVLSHVLEHVKDLSEALHCIKKILKKDGWLYVEVPDAQRYSECLIAPFQDFNLEHINHFSRESLVNLLASCGFESFSSGAKTLDLEGGGSYPAAYAFARQGPVDRVVQDNTTREKLSHYVTASQEVLEQVNGRLRSLAASQVPVAVWGVGQLTMRLLRNSVLGKCNIAVFVDSNSMMQGKHMRGISIVSPQMFCSRMSEVEALVVGSMVNNEAILRSLAEVGFEKPIMSLS